jgi:hypothetical protein
VRGDHHGTAAEQLSVTEEAAECRHALVIEAAARLVEDEDVWRCGKGHDDCQPTSLAVGEPTR